MLQQNLQPRVIHDFRRSTRVPIQVTLDVLRENDAFSCGGETIVVNMHGALIATDAVLRLGERIIVGVYLTGKRAAARVVDIRPDNPRHFGIELERAENIWGIPLPPADWDDAERG